MIDPRRRSALVSLALFLGLGCRSQETRGAEKVRSAVVHGQYGSALEEARRLMEASPNDSEAQALYREAEIAVLLDEGRTAVFQGELELGLERFEEADARVPGHPTVQTWLRKTRLQLADHWLDRAAEVSSPEQLSEAEEAYERVLQYDPSNTKGIDGLSRVLLLKNYRAGMSKTYFDDGLSSFRALLLEQARRSFQVSRRYEPNEPAEHRGHQVEAMIAEERLAQARELERAGSYFAARNEYRLVLLIDPENAAGRDGLDRMDRETRATRTLDEADMALRRGELEQAGEALAEAAVLTEVQKDDVQLLQSGIVEKRLEEQYLAARGLADDYRFPEAVAAFETLIAEAPDYKDAILRKATLEEFIRLAEEFYAKALAASDDTVAEEYLRAIHPVIWPEYKDVVERLRAIEARRASEEEATPPTEEPPTPAEPGAAAQGEPGPRLR
jgi:tetratricopeptide (TPR) repeat protein